MRTATVCPPSGGTFLEGWGVSGTVTRGTPGETPQAPPPSPTRAGARKRRRPWRRAQGLGGTLGVTALGALWPGAGYLWSGRKVLGLLLMTLSLAAVGATVWYVAQDPRAALDIAFAPSRLKTVAIMVSAVFALWALVVLTTYLMVRPRQRRRSHTVVGTAFVLLLCLAVAAPVALTARYSLVQADLVETVFEDNQSATAPKDVTVEDPWNGRDRVNVLLLGGDGGVDRVGVRTDSMILMSLHTRTGRTTMFSLPRNMMNAPFPRDSPLHDLYPNGFNGSSGDPGGYLLNAVYRVVPEEHPKVLGRTDNEGADALKQAVEATLGQPVDYYVLVNLQGFRQIVDAMGGVTVNINSPIPIGGNTDLGVPPDDYLDPGPDQRLNGFEALWYSRGRYGGDDYQRMDRQRCMIGAIIDEAKPLNLLRRYQGAGGGREADRPQRHPLLPAAGVRRPGDEDQEQPAHLGGLQALGALLAGGPRLRLDAQGGPQGDRATAAAQALGRRPQRWHAVPVRLAERHGDA